MSLSKIIVFDMSKRGSMPRVLTVDTAVGSALVRAGVAAAHDSSQAGALSLGSALSGISPTEIVLAHGRNLDQVIRITVPLAAAQAVAAIGAAAGVLAPIASNIVVSLPAPANTALPAITGTAQAGQVLTASTGSWSGAPTSYAYQWYRDAAPISGAVNASRTLDSADVGHSLTCAVTASNSGGDSLPAISAATAIIVAAPTPIPVNTVAPVISGTAAVGQTLASTTGTWSNSPTGYAYAWRRDGVDISGATASTYVAASADQGHAITCRVAATNGGGTAGQTSNAISVAAATGIQAAPAVKYGLNLRPAAYGLNQSPYSNNASGDGWRYYVGSAGYSELDPTYVDNKGNLIAMRAGTIYGTFCQRSGLAAGWQEITWTGAGQITPQSDGVGTVSSPTNVSANKIRFYFTPSSDPEDTSGFSLAVAYTSAANPVMDLKVIDIDGSGNPVNSGDIRDSWVASHQGIDTLRMMDELNINDRQLIPLDWPDRTPDGCRAPLTDSLEASKTFGSGTSALTYRGFNGYGYNGVVEFAAMMALTGGGHSTGAAGRRISIEHAAAQAVAEVSLTGTFPGNLAIKLTPATGNATANGYADLINQEAVCTGYVSGNVLTLKTVSSGKVLKGHSVQGSANGIPFKAVITAQTGGTTNGAGTYTLSMTCPNFGSDASPQTIYTFNAALALVGVVSGGAGAVAPSAAAFLDVGGFDPRNVGGQSLERLIRKANATLPLGGSFHFQIKARATDLYVRNALILIRDTLRADLFVRVEYGNEAWNFGGTYLNSSTWLSSLGGYAGGAPADQQRWNDGSYGYAYRQRQIMVIAEDVFSATPTRLIRVTACVQAVIPSQVVPFITSSDPRYLAPHTDEVVTAPYYGYFISPDGYKGAWASGAAVNKFDYFTHTDGLVYFATSAHTTTGAAPTADANMKVMTGANLSSYMFADIDAQLAYVSQLKTLLAGVTNDRGVQIVWGGYEGGYSGGVGPMNYTPDATAATALKNCHKAILQSAEMKKWESYHLYRIKTLFPEGMYRQFGDINGPVLLGTNFGLSLSDWSTDATSPRRTAFREATQGVFSQTTAL